MKFVLILAVLLGGCETRAKLDIKPVPPTPPSIVKSPPPDDPIFDHAEKQLDITNRMFELSVKTLTWVTDCKNEAAYVWEEKHCDQRKKQLLRNLSVISKEQKELDNE